MKFFKLKSKRTPYASSLVVLFILLFSFQNCSQPGAISVSPGSSVGDLGSGQGDPSNPVGGNPGMPAGPTTKVFGTDTFANTELNTPVTFQLMQVAAQALSGVRVTDTTFATLNGKLEVVSLADFKFKYTPNVGYRGSEKTLLNGADDSGNKIEFNVNVVVANPVQDLKPALAIRGMACIQCHAKVESNIVTDFGFGDSYFFSANTGDDRWKSGGLYGDHDLSFSTIDMKSSAKVIVPSSATLPSQVMSGTSQASLAAYIRSRFAVAEVARTKAVVVEEKSKIYIGAPTAADISAAFSLKDNERSKYFKNSDNAVALSGLSDQATFFKNSGVLNCEGDLAIRGPLYLNNLEVNSSTGCRLYVIGSVFIFGEIKQTNASDSRNLQITSTKSISMGLGLTKKNGAFCEPNSRFATDPGYNVSSLRNRYVTFWTVPSQITRTGLDPVAAGNAIMSEAALIEAKEGPLMDSACRAEGRNISFSRLLLNAPAVHSRYEGNFAGTVIAEYSIMALNQFKFEYDPVFDKTPILPLLNHKVYLNIE